MSKRGELRSCHLSSEASVLTHAGQAALNHVIGDGSWASECEGRLRRSWLEAPGLLQLIQHVACEAWQVHAPSLQEEHTEGRHKPLHDGESTFSSSSWRVKSKQGLIGRVCQHRDMHRTLWSEVAQEGNGILAYLLP